jgi:hypothetical protein
MVMNIPTLLFILFLQGYIMVLKTKDLRLDLRINPILEARIKPGKNVLESLSKGLIDVSKDIETIQEMDVPLDALEDARKQGCEVRKVSISGHYQQHFDRGYNFIVSYETIRGRELGYCKTYTSKELEEIRA